MGEVKKERMVPVLFHESKTVISNEISEIHPLGSFNGRSGLEIEVAPGGHERFIESPPGRVILRAVAKVPFAEHGGGITCGLKGLGHGESVQGQIGFIPGHIHFTVLRLAPLEGVHGVNTSARGILTTHDTGPCRGAVGEDPE